MLDEQSKGNIVEEIAYYYSIRLLITHPTLSPSEITAALGMEPDHSWSAGERQFTKNMMWSCTSWTEGKRLFFDEVHEVLVWLDEQHVFVSQLLASGGEFQVIVQLPGKINIGDTLKLETMSLAVKLGVTLGVEIFPNLTRPMLDSCEEK